MLAELKRRIDNLIGIGEVHSTSNDEGKSLGTVNLGGRITDLLPVMSLGNKFKKHFIPLRVGEQVLVVSPFGEGNFGIIIRNIFSSLCKEPLGGDENTEIIEYEDGARFSYNVETHEMRFETKGEIVIKASKVTIDTMTLDVTGEINDNKGTLTNHTHSVENHSVAISR
jgi:phage baseplate assembly protein V